MVSKCILTFLAKHLNNRVFITDEDDSVVAFNAETEELIGQIKLFLRRLTGPTVVSSYVAVGDFEGYVHFWMLAMALLLEELGLSEVELLPFVKLS